MKNTTYKLKVHDIETGMCETFEMGLIPDKYLWAYRHIFTHDCGSISCGKTVFELIKEERPVTQ